MEEALNHSNIAIRHLANIYIRDIIWNCRTIARSYEAMMKISQDVLGYYEENPDGGKLVINAEFQREVINIINCATNLKNLIRPSVKRSKSETASAHKFRQSRFKVFQSALDGLDITAIYDNQVRNALEHFDEHLDDFLRAAIRKGEEEATVKFYNISFTDKQVITSTTGETHLKSYFFVEGEFVVFGQKVDILKIIAEADAINLRICQVFNVGNNDNGYVVMPWSSES